MAYVNERAVVPGAIEEIFEYIADHRRALSWLDGFTRFEWVGGPERGVGARVRTEGRIFSFFRGD